MESIDITTAIAFGGFCLGVYNCVLEIVRRHPRAVVRLRKRFAIQDGIDKGFTATIANVGEVAFTVTEAYLVKRDGERVSPLITDACDKIPKIVNPGEVCELQICGVDGKKHAVLRDVVRAVFAISSGKEFRSKKIPKGVEDKAFRPVVPLIFTAYKVLDQFRKQNP